jgi:threonine dehydrogenase-like Zn-dependent dehydrogenase
MRPRSLDRNTPSKFKGQSIGTGQCNVKLEQAPEGYENFDKRNEGWTEVVLKPRR